MFLNREKKILFLTLHNFNNNYNYYFFRKIFRNYSKKILREHYLFLTKKKEERIQKEKKKKEILFNYKCFIIRQSLYKNYVFNKYDISWKLFQSPYYLNKNLRKPFIKILNKIYFVDILAWEKKEIFYWYTLFNNEFSLSVFFKKWFFINYYLRVFNLFFFMIERRFFFLYYIYTHKKIFYFFYLTGKRKILFIDKQKRIKRKFFFLFNRFQEFFLNYIVKLYFFKVKDFFIIYYPLVNYEERFFFLFENFYFYFFFYKIFIKNTLLNLYFFNLFFFKKKEIFFFKNLKRLFLDYYNIFFRFLLSLDSFYFCDDVNMLKFSKKFEMEKFIIADIKLGFEFIDKENIRPEFDDVDKEKTLVESDEFNDEKIIIDNIDKEKTLVESDEFNDEKIIIDNIDKEIDEINYIYYVDKEKMTQILLNTCFYFFFFFYKIMFDLLYIDFFNIHFFDCWVYNVKFISWIFLQTSICCMFLFIFLSFLIFGEYIYYFLRLLLLNLNSLMIVIFYFLDLLFFIFESETDFEIEDVIDYLYEENLQNEEYYFKEDKKNSKEFFKKDLNFEFLKNVFLDFDDLKIFEGNRKKDPILNNFFYKKEKNYNRIWHKVFFFYLEKKKSRFSFLKKIYEF